MTHVLNDPEHWLKRAEEARTLAGELTDSEARRMMLNIADGYDRLAKRAEARAKFNERFDAADFELHVVGDDIIVNVPGTRFTITFQRTPDKTGIEEKHAWARDDMNSPFSMTEFRTQAWEAASKQAYALGWIPRF